MIAAAQVDVSQACSTGRAWRPLVAVPGGEREGGLHVDGGGVDAVQGSGERG